jgi:hypothetical protein
MAIRKVISRSVQDVTGVDIIADTAAPVRHSVDPSLLLDFVNAKTLDPRITFTRGSSAMYYDGTTALAEQNLLPHSQTISGSSGQGMTPANAAATAPDGTNTAVSVTVNSANDRHFFVTSRTDELAPPAGTTFTGSGFVKKNTADYVAILISDNAIGGGARYGITLNLTNGTVGGFSPSTGAINTSYTVSGVGNGWYRVTLTMTTANNSPGAGANMNFSPMPTDGSTYGNTDSYPVWTGNGTSSIYVWGWQMEKRGFATAYTTTTGSAISNYISVLKTAGANQPRFDVDPITKESKGLLIEEQRTNVFNYSNLGDPATFAAQWGNGPNSRDFGSVIGLDGLPSGRRLYSTAAGNSFFARNNSITIPSAGTYVFSVWVRLVAGTTNQAYGYFSAYALSVQMNALPTSQWTRVYGTVTFPNSGTTNFTLPFYDSAAGAIIDYYGPQLELGTFPTSYIPTASASVTRAADLAEITGTNFTNFFNNTAGTAYFEGSIIGSPNTGSSMQGAFAFTRDTGNENVIDLRMQQTGYGNLHVTYGFGGTQAQIQSGGTQATNTTTKFGIAYAANDVAFYRGGTLLGSDTSANIPFGLTKLEIGKGDNSSLKVLNGYVRKFSYYPVRLTNAEIASLTV